MKKATFNILSYSLSLFILFAYSCSTEETVSNQTLDAQTWFKKYEAESPNFDIFQNLEYNWSQAQITTSEDGTQTIIVPIVEQKKKASEIWKQNLYLYKISENNYEALIFEIFPDKNSKISSQSIDGGDFNGYISSWNLKNGFIKAAQFENNKVVQEGIIPMLSSTNNNEQSKMIADPCYLCPEDEKPNGGGGSSPAIPLRDVIIKSKSPSFPPMTFIPRGPTYGGAINPPEYTNPPRGGGGGGSNLTGNTENPCDQIKKQIADVKFKSKIDDLKTKTKDSVEVGYAQKKDGSFPELIKNATDPNQQSLPAGTDFVGSMHTHRDPYPSGKLKSDGSPIMFRPIPIFSHVDVVQFLKFLDYTKTNKIKQADIYSVMVSSVGTYELKFTGNIADVKTKFDLEDLEVKYRESIKANNENKELGFLKFLENHIGIKGIELYKIQDDGTSIKKSLDANKDLVETPC